jgi:hypothetical protein
MVIQIKSRAYLPAVPPKGRDCNLVNACRLMAHDGVYIIESVTCLLRCFNKQLVEELV